MHAWPMVYALPVNLPRKPMMMIQQNYQKTKKTRLRLTPYAWSKLLFLRDVGPTEVGAFAESNPNDLLLIQDVHLIKQQTSPVTVAFDDGAVADYFDARVDQGQRPEEFGRIWVHTHPGHSAEPSSTDEATFARCFGPSDWAVMFILACGGQTYARLRFRAGPGGELLLPVEITYEHSFQGSNAEVWYEEYQRCVEQLPAFQPVERPFWPEVESHNKMMQLARAEWEELEEYYDKELMPDYVGY